VAADPESQRHRILAVSKSNLTLLPTSLRFTIEAATNGACRVAWLGTSPLQADELIGRAQSPEDQDRLREAILFLQTLLADGPLPADECIRQARALQISEKTLRRAKTRLHIRSFRAEDNPVCRWLWELRNG